MHIITIISTDYDESTHLVVWVDARQLREGVLRIILHELAHGGVSISREWHCQSPAQQHMTLYEGMSQDSGGQHTHAPLAASMKG